MIQKEFEFEGSIVRFLCDENSCVGEQLVGKKPPIVTVDMLKESLSPIIKVGKAVVDEAMELAPNEVTIELGLDIGFESGNLCWGIAKGSAATHFNISMTWKDE